MVRREAPPEDGICPKCGHEVTRLGRGLLDATCNGCGTTWAALDGGGA